MIAAGTIAARLRCLWLKSAALTEDIMPILFGLILGVILTIAGAYAYDSSTGRASNGLSPNAAGRQAPLVNWDVVSDDWNEFQTNVQTVGADLERSVKRHTG
jgi:hypothetical protein